MQMECSKVRILLFRNLDGELAAPEARELETHISGCAACSHEKKLLAIPREIGRAIPVLQPSPYFYARLRARLESENQAVTFWQILLTLSRHLLPAFAAVTLALLSVFAYYQVREPQEDTVQAYDWILQSLDRPHVALLGAQGDVNDEVVLGTIVEDEDGRKPVPVSEKPNTP
jgi:anti-sigma factor RsiW